MPGSVTDKNYVFLPFSYSGTHVAFDDRFVYSCSDDDGAWSSVDEHEQHTDTAPQSVIVQLDVHCDKISHSEQVILAHTYLSDELLATDSLVLRTVPRLSTLTQVALPA